MFNLGIHVTKAKLDCALRLPNGKYRNKVVENNHKGYAELGAWLRKHEAGSARVCMEAGGTCWQGGAEYLAEQGMVVSIVNPDAVPDKVNGQWFAEFGHIHQPEPWLPPTPAERRLREMVWRLDQLHTMHQQESNRLDIAREALRQDILDHLTWLDKEIQGLSLAIRNQIDEAPELNSKRALLHTIPGLGERMISVLLSALQT
jgi:transposase